MLPQHILKHPQTIGVHQVLENDRIVERLGGKLGIQAGAQAESACGLLGFGEQRLSLGRLQATGVGVAQARCEATDEIREAQAVVPQGRCLVLRRRVVAGGEKRHGPAHPDKGGE